MIICRRDLHDRREFMRRDKGLPHVPYLVKVDLRLESTLALVSLYPCSELQHDHAPAWISLPPLHTLSGTTMSRIGYVSYDVGNLRMVYGYLVWVGIGHCILKYPLLNAS